jgi:prepilin peptidase CpaA
MQIIEVISLCTAVILMLSAAWRDFVSWKIPNRTIFALIGTYAVFAIARYFSGIGETDAISAQQSILLSDVAAGLLLFVLGFVLWMFRLFGAGDAKLFFPIGLFVGFDHLTLFAVALAIGAVAVTVALKIPIPIQYHAYRYMARLEEIRSTGKIPYGVLMAAATLAAMYSRYVSA